jgi:succinate dehydrogenase/fumarate reductase flavoprotein subunit
MSTGLRGHSYDVVIVGGGGAGLAAAVEARKVGREVLLLEKNPALGGSTAWSIGSGHFHGTAPNAVAMLRALVFGRIAGRNAIQSD